jgi:hypothetical protein
MHFSRVEGTSDAELIAGVKSLLMLAFWIEAWELHALACPLKGRRTLSGQGMSRSM